MTHPQRELYPEIQRSLFWQGQLPQNCSEEEPLYRYVTCTNRHYQKSPSLFSIELTKCDGDPHSTICRPGSIIEGFVHLTLESPLAAQYIKLVFKAAEHVHNDGGNNVYKKKGERLFAIRTFLWGKPITEATNKWPVIESGDHRIPFMCELPMVNYPPSFSHDLASCEFTLFATIERPGIRPFETSPFHIHYEPYIMSEELERPQPYHETIDISDDLKATLTLPSGCGVNLLDTEASPFQFKLAIKSKSEDNNNKNTHQTLSLFNSSNNLEATIVRKIEVRYGSRRRKDTMVMCQVGQSSFIPTSDHSYQVQLNLPTQANQHKNQLSPKSFPFLGMTTSLSFSRFITIEYQLCVTNKVKHGLISSKKQLFCVPIMMGTLPPGVRVPSSIYFYRDPQVTADPSLLTKPKFLKQIPQEEQLPAYTEEAPPPDYSVKTYARTSVGRA